MYARAIHRAGFLQCRVAQLVESVTQVMEHGRGFESRHGT